MNKPIRAPRKAGGTGFNAEFLDAKTEAELARAWRETGDQRARDRLVMAHRALAYGAAARASRAMGGRGPDEDLIQQANLGLLKAVDRFDPEMGFRFSTYAAWWVRAEIQDFSYADYSLIRLPGSSSLRRLFFGLRKAEAALRAEGVAPQDIDARIAADYGIDVGRVQLVRERLSAKDLSLNQSLGNDEGGGEWQDLLEDPDPMADAETRVGEDQAQRVLGDLLKGHLAQLPERDRQIVEGAVMSEDQRTLADLGAEMKISRERVRQLRERALESLRKTVANDPKLRALLGHTGVSA